MRSEVFEIEQLADLLPSVGGNHQAGWCSERLQPRGEIGRLTDDRLLLRGALADQIADDHQPGGDSDPRLEIGGLNNEATHSVDRAQCGPDRSFSVVLMGAWIAEIDENTIAHILGDETIEPGNDFSDRAVIGADDLTQILGVKKGRERRRAHQIAEHHRELPALGIGPRPSLPRERGRAREGVAGCGGLGAERGNGFEQFAPVTDRDNPDLLEILRCQLRQHLSVDRVRAKRRLVLGEPKTLQPISNFHVRKPSPRIFLHRNDMDSAASGRCRPASA